MGRVRLYRSGSQFDDGWSLDCLASNLVPGRIEGHARNPGTGEGEAVRLDCPPDFYERLVALLDQLEPSDVADSQPAHLVIGLKKTEKELFFRLAAPSSYKAGSPARMIWDLIDTAFRGSPYSPSGT